MTFDEFKKALDDGHTVREIYPDGVPTVLWKEDDVYWMNYKNEKVADIDESDNQEAEYFWKSEQYDSVEYNARLVIEFTQPQTLSGWQALKALEEGKTLQSREVPVKCWLEKGVLKHNFELPSSNGNSHLTVTDFLNKQYTVVDEGEWTNCVDTMPESKDYPVVIRWNNEQFSGDTLRTCRNTHEILGYTLKNAQWRSE